VSKPFV